MTALLAWLWTGSLALVVLIPLAWGASRLLRRFSGAPAAYLAWTLPLAALIPMEFLGSFLPTAPAMTVASEPFAVMAMSEAGSTAGAVTVSWLLPGIWLAGVMALATYFGLRHGRFLARLRCGERAPAREEPATTVGLPAWVRVRYSTTCPGPMVVGVLPPTLWLPANFHQAPAEQREMMLAHERAHLRHGDPLWLLTALVFTCLFWFHPLVHAAWFRFRSDQELAADAAVITARSRVDRRGYAHTLCRTAGLQANVLGLGGLRPSMLKERVHMIADQRPRPMPFGISAVLLAAMFLASGWVIAGSGEPPRVSNLEPEEVTNPEWPRKAVTEGISGHVRMELEINEEGYVTEADVIDAEPEGVFERAAHRAVRQWRFPEQNEPVIAEQTIRFELAEDGE